MILLVRDAQGTEILVNVTKITDVSSGLHSQIDVEWVDTDDENLTETIDLNRNTVEVLSNG